MTEQKTYTGLAWIAAMAFFMQTLDATILNTALPTISQNLNESPLNMQLAIISYALTVALFIPLSGWLADKYGTLNVFRVSIAIFVLGSIACAFSYSLSVLVFSRILQGFGGALMMPVARLAIIRTVPKNQLLNAWNIMAMAGLIGPILGPVLGGLIVTYLTWHWIFLINIPIGLAGMLLAKYAMPNIKGQSLPLDIIGFILFAGGLVGVTLGLDLVAEHFTTPWIDTTVLTSGVMFLFAYIYYAKQIAHPLLPLSLFQIRTFRLGFIANLFIRLCGSGVPFLLPLMLQVVFHYSPEMAGWLMVPIAVSSMAFKPLIKPILFRFGYKKTLIGTGVLMTLTIATMSLLQQQTPVWQMVLILLVYGGCMSVSFTAVNTLTVGDLSESNASAGSTMLSIIQQVGIGIGIAVSSVILGVYRNLLSDNSEQLQNAFSYTFLTSSLFGIVLVLILRGLKKQDGNNLQIEKPKEAE
ncbi:DHA2 family efflux MFS transporter permease subunit [Avibacterium paragallinarum]|uniref:DHA2 family efflux MFS transporter permease subunit n=1 Tax=Avibacterium paragallinarum TaxID=728 RepID=UPI0039791B83